MKECKGWKSDDGKMQSFVKQHVVDYELERASYSIIDEEMGYYSIDDCEGLVQFLGDHEDDIRKIMGWEQITF